MKLTEDVKEQIDSMSYKSMFCLWRFAPAGEPMFAEESGEYFRQVFEERRTTLPAGEHAHISKQLEWS